MAINNMTANHVISNDLNLLKIFALLLAECNLSRAAVRLGLTQPGLSRALSRLREEFDDPLFVRAPGGMLPTPKALALEKPLLAALDHLEGLYAAPVEFKPESATGIVRIATTDYFEQVVWVELAGKLSRIAPRMTFVTKMTGSDVPIAHLRSGDVQLAIAGFFNELPGGLVRQTLMTDRFVCVVRKNHPTVGKKLTMENYLKLGHIVVSARGDFEGTVTRMLRAKGLTRHVAASVCSFLSSGQLAATSDLILTAPARLVEHFVKHLPVAVLEPPLALPPIKVNQVWHERYQNDPLHAWLRAEIAAAIG